MSKKLTKSEQEFLVGLISKKVVEKKPEVVNKTEPKVNSMQYKKSNYSQYSLYQEIKEKSEKSAKLKMVDDISSDDNGDDNYY